MDPFQIVLWCIAITIAAVFIRPFVGMFNVAIRGCIKSTRKTLHMIRN